MSGNEQKTAPSPAPAESAGGGSDRPVAPVEESGARTVVVAAGRLEKVAPKPNFEKLFPKTTAQTMTDDQLNRFKNLGDEFWRKKATILGQMKGNLKATVDPAKVKTVLNLRNDSGKVDAKLAPNTEVVLTALEYRKADGVDFVKVKAGEKEGWVALQYLKPDPAKSKEAVTAKVDADEKALVEKQKAEKAAELRFTNVELQEVRGYATGDNLRPAYLDHFKKGTDDLEKLAVNQIVVLDTDVQGNDPYEKQVIIKDGTPVRVIEINKNLNKVLAVRDSIGNTATVSIDDVDAAGDDDVQEFAQTALEHDQEVWDKNLAIDKSAASWRVLVAAEKIVVVDIQGHRREIAQGKRVEICQKPGLTYITISIGMSRDPDWAVFDVRPNQMQYIAGTDERFAQSDNIVKIKKAVIISQRSQKTGVEWDQGETKSDETVAILGTLGQRVLIRTSDGREGFIGRDAIDEATLMARKDLERFQGNYDEALAARNRPTANAAG